MAHPTEWWLTQNENKRSYQSIDACNGFAGQENGGLEDNDEASNNNPLHDFLNNSILSYKRPRTDDNSSPCSEAQSSISDEISLDSQVEPPHKTLSVLLFDVIRFIAMNADIRLINTQLWPILNGVVGQKFRLPWVGGMSDEKMEILHVALRVFMAMFGVLLLLIEFPDTFPILQVRQQNPLSLYNWIPRGIFYIFLSVVIFEEAIVVRALDMDQHYSNSSRLFDSLSIVLAAWLMLITGVMYLLLGMCCLQKVMERVRAEEKESWIEYYEHLRLLDQQSDLEENQWFVEGEEGCCCQCCNTWCEGLLRWYRRVRRRRDRGEGFCSILGCRSLECR